MIHVPVPCEYRWPERQCGAGPLEHVHRPTPCDNGRDERHHAYRPPKSVLLDIAGQTRRVRLGVAS